MAALSAALLFVAQAAGAQGADRPGPTTPTAKDPTGPGIELEPQTVGGRGQAVTDRARRLRLRGWDAQWPGSIPDELTGLGPAGGQSRRTGRGGNRSSLAGRVSDPEALFVPNDLVPLSQFVFKDAREPAVMHVEPRILAWVLARPAGRVEVALRDSRGAVHIVPATEIQDDTVRLESPLAGDCVVVSRDLTHVLRAQEHHSIVTHWDDTGRGTCSFGARDARTTLDYDPVLGEDVRNGTLLSPPGSLHTWDTANKNLFSDGSGEPQVENARVPGFERYIGETYAIAAPTNLRAVSLSDSVREATGWPVAHHNLLANAGDDLPLFQLVHAQLVDIANLYPQQAGDENSLATYVLPPDWSSTAEPASYPILFNGFYDVHGSTFGGTGQRFMETLGQLHDDSDGTDLAVGLLWNGGGAAVTPTLHRSAWDNAARLIADAASLLAADADAILFAGISRGGTTALAMASNPLGAPYTAAAVHAMNPQVDILEALYRYLNPAYVLIQRSTETAIGYRDSWNSTWTVPPGEPGAGTPRNDMLRRNFFGTLDDLKIAADYTINSAKFRDGLEAAGPEIVLALGTHDYSKPFAQPAAYVNALEATNLTVLCQVYYRFGHAVTEGFDPSYADLLERIFQKRRGLTPPALTNNPGGVELQFFATDPADPETALPIAAPHVPAIVEYPIVVGDAQDFSVVFVGEPNAFMQLFQAPMDEPGGWEPGLECFGGVPCTAANGSCLGRTPFPSCYAAPPSPVLPGLPFLSSGPVFGITVLDIRFRDVAIPPGYRWIECYYGPAGGRLPQIGQGDLALMSPLGPTFPAGLTQILSPCSFSLDYAIRMTLYDQPLFRVTGCAPEVLGHSEITRTGGLAGDRLFLR